MERASNSSPNECIKETVLDLKIDSAVSTSTDPLSEEKESDNRRVGDYTVDTAKVNKPPVIQLLKACDQNTHLDLFLCLEDTAELGTWKDNVYRSNNSKMTEEIMMYFKGKASPSEQTHDAEDINHLHEYQKLEEIPSDHCSNQSIVDITTVLMQQVGRRSRKNRRCIVSPTRIAMPQLSSEEIRMNVCHSFQAILLHRLRGVDDLNINDDVVQDIAINIEKELFLLFFCTNTRYKNKYRSLMFNLKDPKNTHLFRQVLLGGITPQCLVLMSPTELASLELMEWRERENKHSIKLITTEAEFDRQPLIKLTHKGEIEIERNTDQNFTLEDLMDYSPQSIGRAELSDSERNTELDTRNQHRSHLLDRNCQICTAAMEPPVKSRRSELPWITSHLPDSTTDTSTSENTSSHFKSFSPMGNRGGSETPTISVLRHRRFISGACVWKGFIQTSNMKRFLVKAYPVLGHTDHLTKMLSTIITVRRCVLPETIWDSVDALEPSKAKEMCIVRFKPVTEGDLGLYTSYYSYLNSRQRYGAVLLAQNLAKGVCLLPLPALQKLPSRLPPLSGPGLKSSHPDLLLAMAFSKTQQSGDAFRKSRVHGRNPERCLQKNKSRQKTLKVVDRAYHSGHSQLSPFLVQPRNQPHILPVLPAVPFPCQIEPSDMLIGDTLSNEELLPCMDLSNISAAEILQLGGIGNLFGPFAFTNDGLDENLGLNIQCHGGVSRKGNESKSTSEKLFTNQELIAQFTPEDVLTENVLFSVTQLNSLFQQEESDVPIKEQEGDLVETAPCDEDTKTYLAELDKLFAKFPLNTGSQDEDRSHFQSTISSCADVLNNLLSARNNSLDCKDQVPTFPNKTPNKDPECVVQPGSSSLTLQMPSNTQHLGHRGVLTAESRVLPLDLTASSVTMQQQEVPYRSSAEIPCPFKFTSCDQRGTDEESHQPQKQDWSTLYCLSQHHHGTNLNKHNGRVNEHPWELTQATVLEPHKFQNTRSYEG